MKVKSFSPVNFRRPPASIRIRTAFYMQHLFIHSTVSTKQNNTHGVAQQTTYKRRVFYSILIPNRGLCLSCFSNVWKITYLRNAILNVFMHKKHTCIIAYWKDSKHFLCLLETSVLFIGEILFLKKTWMSAYWRRCPHTGGVKSRFQQKISWIMKSWLIMQIIKAFI